MKWLYRWLPIIFGCHCRDDRSFHIRGTKFPLCARCTGELVGILLALVISFFYRLSIPWAVAIMIPMIIDGFVQLKTNYESTNARRAITGFFFGYGLATLFVISTIAAFMFGYNFMQK